MDFYMKVNRTGIMSFVIIMCGWYYVYLISNDILLRPLFIFDPILIIRFLFYFMTIVIIGIIGLVFSELGNELNNDTVREEIIFEKYTKKERPLSDIEGELGVRIVSDREYNLEKKITIFDKLFYFYGYPFLSPSNDLTNFKKGPNFYFLSLPSVTVFVLICFFLVLGLVIGLPMVIFDLDSFFDDLRYKKY
tara:strand:- start:397 stop:972 length:576 start_codon:yes stop_codon:yes gene_type:complete